MDRNKKWWGISLIVIGAVTLIQTGLRLAGIELPGAAVILMGAIDLVMAFMLIYTTIQILGKKK